MTTYYDKFDDGYKVITPGGWKYRLKCPKWYDRQTIGCPHPEGVIIATSSDKTHHTSLAFIDLRRTAVLALKDLCYPSSAMGMV